MDALIERQQQLSARIFNALDNCKKLAKEKVTREAIVTRMEVLDATWEKFEDVHTRITLKKDDPLKAELQAFFALTEEKYIDTKTEMRRALASFVPVETDTGPPGGSHSRQLPKIHLPSFSGAYIDWPNFRDLFSSLIKENRDLTNVERLHYLKTSVSGEAADLLRNIATTEENFARAWETLFDRYQNKRLLVNAQLSSLSSLKPLTQESSSQLRTLFAGVNDALSALAALGRPVTHWDDWIVFVTAQRLDPSSRRDWEKSIGLSVEPLSWAELKKFINGRILTLESLESATGKPKPTAGPSRSLTTSVKSHQASTGSPTCACCSSEHFILQCPQFRGKTPEERRQIVVSKQLCYNCLGGHRVSLCRSTKRCQQCSGHHHTVLHGAAKSGETASVNAVSSASTSRDGAGSSSQARATHALACNIRSVRLERTLVLLATALVQVEDHEGCLFGARALLDQGSETSLIASNLVQRLHLPKLATSISIVGIGKKSTAALGKVVANVHSSIDTGRSYRVNAMVLPSLTSYSPVRNVVRQSWPHIEGLQLADPYYDTDDQIDLILGADVYAEVLEDGVRKGPAGSPVAQNTTLGWILSGALDTGG